MRGRLIPLSCVLSLAALSIPVTAPFAAETASPCKGLAESACGEQATCNWVNGYTRSDGRAVGGYCRLKRPATQGTANQQHTRPEAADAS